MLALEKGIKIEREHKETYDWLLSLSKSGQFPTEREFYESIATDHLSENERYYDMLAEMESSFE